MKIYVKPELFYESFTTADCIAACTLKAMAAENVCGGAVLDGNGQVIISVFNALQTGCDVHPQGEGDICYGNVTANYTVFGS